MLRIVTIPLGKDKILEIIYYGSGETVSVTKQKPIGKYDPIKIIS